MTITINAVINRTVGSHHALVTWTLVGASQGNPVQMEGYRLRSITIGGSYNAGTVTILGGNDDTQTDTAVGIKDRSGTAISNTTAAFYQIPEAPNWLYPSATAATSVVVRAYYERLV